MRLSAPLNNKVRALLSLLLVIFERWLLLMGERSRIAPATQCAGLLLALLATYYLMPEWFATGLFRTFWQVCVGVLALGLVLSILDIFY